MFGEYCGGKGTLHRTILTKFRICVAPCIVLYGSWGWPIEEGVVVLPYLSHSDMVSCNISSNMWGMCICPGFC